MIKRRIETQLAELIDTIPAVALIGRARSARLRLRSK